MIRITSSGLIRISALGVLQWRQRRQSQLPKQVCVAPVSRQAPKRRMYTSQSQLTRTLVHRLVKICKRLLQFPESDVHNPKECRLHIFVFADLLELAQYSARFCMLPSHSVCIADKCARLRTHSSHPLRLSQSLDALGIPAQRTVRQPQEKMRAMERIVYLQRLQQMLCGCFSLGGIEKHSSDIRVHDHGERVDVARSKDLFESLIVAPQRTQRQRIPLDRSNIVRVKRNRSLKLLQCSGPIPVVPEVDHG